MKKTIALILAMVVCLSLFAGCKSSELRSYSEDADTEETTVKDYTKAYESYKPDQVMLTVNGIDVTWSTLFYWYYYDVSQIESNYGDIDDWNSAAAFDETMTYSEYLTEAVYNTVVQYSVILSKAAEQGVTLSDEEIAAIDESWQTNVDSYGDEGEEAFIEYLETVFLSKDLYNSMSEISALYNAMLVETYGAQGEKLSDTDVLAKAEDMGYYRTKNLLLSTVDESGTALSDEEIAKQKLLAETLYTELKAISDPTALEARFDELMAQYSSDTTAVTYFPDGYTELPGALVEAYETAALALGDNQISEIVETNYGYHIILKLPLSLTAIVEYASETEQHTLAYKVAQELFAVQTENWAKEAEVETTSKYEKMNLAKVLAKAEKVPVASSAPLSEKVPVASSAPLSGK